MSRHILYAYVDGYDLEDVATAFEADITSFLKTFAWPVGKAWLVSQRESKKEQSTDLPRWDLGVNLELTETREEMLPYFANVEDLVVFLRSQSEKIDREFVLGISDTCTRDTWEFAFIGVEQVNIERIRRALLP